MVTQVLGQIDLRGNVVTADAPHTVNAAGAFICEHDGEFVFPVKENRKALFAALDRQVSNQPCQPSKTSGRSMINSG